MTEEKHRSRQRTLATKLLQLKEVWCSNVYHPTNRIVPMPRDLLRKLATMKHFGGQFADTEMVGPVRDLVLHGNSERMVRMSARCRAIEWASNYQERRTVYLADQPPEKDVTQLPPSVCL